MSHYTCAYKTTDKEKTIASLDRGAFNGLKLQIYSALNCLDCVGLGSGNDTKRVVSKEELVAALAYLGDSEDLEPEREFISHCLAHVDEAGKFLFCICVVHTFRFLP